MLVTRVVFAWWSICGLVVGLAGSSLHAGADSLEMKFLSRYSTGIVGQGAAEIVSYDKKSQCLFVVNGAKKAIDVVDLADPAKPVLKKSIDLSSHGAPTHCATLPGKCVAVSVANKVKTDPGKVVFIDVKTMAVANEVPVGALPDMLTFTPDGKMLLVANEGEPNDDYTVDPEGSISIIDMAKGFAKLDKAAVKTVNFKIFEGVKLDETTRIFGPNATYLQDLEPEYIAVNPTSDMAWVTLQENNSVAVLDLKSKQFTKIVGLGTKDFSLPKNGFDASDKDGKINIASWPVQGLYLPDGIAVYAKGDATYVYTANEGDSRDYKGFSEETRVGKVKLNQFCYPNAKSLQTDENLGRLKITTTMGNPNNKSFELLYAFGARSISVWDASCKPLWDSGDFLEQMTAERCKDFFNASNDSNTFDDRSDDKGPEPEVVTIAQVGGADYLFVGLERIGGIAAFSLADPAKPAFAGYVNSRDPKGDPKAGTAGDLGVEGLIVIPAKDNPMKVDLLVAANESSGTVSIYTIKRN